MSLAKERALELERAETMLKGIHIPPCPDILLKVLDEQGRREPDIDRIAEIIGGDVAIAAATLKVVNSPFFGLQRRVSSVQHAVRLLGIRNIVNIVTGLMLHSAFRSTRGPLMDKFLDQSNKIAVAAALAGRLCRGIASEEAYAAGLFANCGVPMLMRRFPEYPDVYEAAERVEDQTHTAYEDAQLGTDHAVIGYMVAKSWKLPEAFCETILRHHDADDYYSQPHPDVEADMARSLALLLLATHVQRLHDGLPPSYEWQQVGDAILAFLKLQPEQVETLQADMAALIAMQGS